MPLQLRTHQFHQVPVLWQIFGRQGAVLAGVRGQVKEPGRVKGRGVGASTEEVAAVCVGQVGGFVQDHLPHLGACTPNTHDPGLAFGEQIHNNISLAQTGTQARPTVNTSRTQARPTVDTSRTHAHTYQSISISLLPRVT